jgi:hypothetical protein
MFTVRRFLVALSLSSALIVPGSAAYSQTPAPDSDPEPTAEPAVSPEVAGRWFEISQLRAGGQYEEAISLLNAMFRDYADADQVLRQAHNELVFTMMASADTVGARASARAALELYPDLEVEDSAAVPQSLNALYGALRAEMYGSLQVTVPEVEEAQVLLDGLAQGFAPLEMAYLKPGPHTVTVLRSGYREQTVEVEITPGLTNNCTVPLSRSGGIRRWLPAAGAAVVAAILIPLATGDSTPGDPELPSLPNPPIPPR